MYRHRYLSFNSLLISVLGLMAIAPTVQAEILKPEKIIKGSFLINKETSLAKAGVTYEANQVGTGVISIEGRNLAILCESGVSKGEFKTTVPVAKEALGRTVFSKCKAFEWVNLSKGEKHKKELPCTIAEPIEVAKKILLPTKHEGQPYLLIEEDPVGSGFTTVKITGAECTLPKENKIQGLISVKFTNNDTIEPSFSLEDEVQTLFGTQILFGAFKAQLSGVFKLKLTDAAHIGKTIGVC